MYDSKAAATHPHNAETKTLTCRHVWWHYSMFITGFGRMRRAEGRITVYMAVPCLLSSRLFSPLSSWQYTQAENHAIVEHTITNTERTQQCHLDARITVDFQSWVCHKHVESPRIVITVGHTKRVLINLHRGINLCAYNLCAWLVHVFTCIFKCCYCTYSCAYTH